MPRSKLGLCRAMSVIEMLRHSFNAHHDDSVALHCGYSKNRLGRLVWAFDAKSRRN